MNKLILILIVASPLCSGFGDEPKEIICKSESTGHVVIQKTWAGCPWGYRLIGYK